MQSAGSLRVRDYRGGDAEAAEIGIYPGRHWATLPPGAAMARKAGSERMQVGRTLIANATIFDATGSPPFAGDLLIDGNRIAAVTPAGQAQHEAGTRIDAAGLFCMPGMTEGHAHLSFENVTATETIDLVVAFASIQDVVSGTTFK